MKMLPKAKHSGVIVPQSDLRVGTAMGEKQLKIAQWNCRGFSQTKKTELEHLLHEENIDVFGSMEANLAADQMEYFNIKGFTVYILPKARQIASGMIIGVKHNITHSFEIVRESNDSNKLEITKMEVWKNKERFRIYFIYNPPNNKLDLNSIVITQKTIVVGDFNGHSQTWGYENSNEIGNTIEDWIISNELELIFDSKQTGTYMHHNGKTFNPDLLMVSSNIANKTQRLVKDSLGSDHRVIIANIKLGKRTIKSKCEKSWNFKRAYWKEYTKELEEKLPNIIQIETNSPDNINNKICKTLIETAKKFIPRGKIKKYKPFWSKELQQLKTEREKARLKAEEDKTRESILEWKRKAAIFKKTLLNVKRNNYDDFVKNLDYRKDSHKVYSYMASMKKENRPKEPLLYKNKKIVDELKIAAIFNTNYTSSKLTKQMKQEQKIMKIDIKKQKSNEKQNLSSTDEIFYKPFTHSEINSAIHKLNNDKSPGPDNIHPEFIKHLGYKARTALLNFFNLVWNTSVPANWKKAIIIPVLKPGKSARDISNYRPISLTSHIAKLMERMISTRLNWFLETNNLISPAQAGFRQYHSTNEQVILLSQEIKEAFNKKEETLAVFVDFKSAYDNVWRYKLIKKLHQLGIKSNMLHWISDFIIQRYCATKYQSSTSSYKQTHIGLPQGSVLSPMLFNVYVNDIPQLLDNNGVKSALFADDLVFWCSHKQKKAELTINAIQSSLNRLTSWCKNNNMTINIAKTQFQFFTLKKESTKINLNCNGSTLQRTEKAKYLGVSFDTKLTWKNHIQQIKDKAINRFKLIKRLAGTKWGSSRKTLSTTYNMYIKPVMKYCSEILITTNKTNKEILERVQNQALRLITGAVKTTPIQALQVITSIKPINMEIETQALITFEKLIRLPKSEKWINYLNSHHTLKTQVGFIQEVSRIKEYLGIPTGKENLLHSYNPINMIRVDHSLDLNETFNKKSSTPQEAKVFALETIHSRYPTQEWIHIYTDGSLLDHEKGAGAGGTCQFFSFYRQVGANTTNYDGEIEAIYTALKNLFIWLRYCNNIVILSDSKAAIQAIASTNCPKMEKIKEIHNMIKQIQALKKNIVLQWIPAHCGVCGNERADFLAKKGAKTLQKTSNKFSYESIKQVIKMKVNNKYKLDITDNDDTSQWRILQKNPKLIPDAPRKTTVAMLRLYTGHDCLSKHLYRIGILNSPNCLLCYTEEMDLEHLKKCNKLKSRDDITSKYWEARRIMTSLSNQEH